MGSYITSTRERVDSGEWMRRAKPTTGISATGSELRELGFDLTGPKEIRARVEKAGLRDIFARRLA